MRSAFFAATWCVFSAVANAQSVTGATFVNGLALDGALADVSGGSSFDRRVGYFSDLYYDHSRNEWWGLSDRGPGGGLLSYETRVQRFTLDFAANGAISNFNILQTVKFNDAGQPLNGLAPNPGSTLGRAFDPEGLVINPSTGTLLVSDEYGPSLLEFDRSGTLLRRFTTPANLVPRNAAGTPNFAGDTGNTLGKRSNRGFEGLAVSPDGRHSYAMLQSALLDEGGGNGEYSRIVKFDNSSGQAVAQYAYKMDSASQGRGISALVALGQDRFLVLERNNRGIGVGATLGAAEKTVVEIDLSGALDVSSVTLPTSGAFAGAVRQLAPNVLDLDANTLATLGGKSPEKWEGLAVGPQLANGQHVLLAGTDNDYSVTQSGLGTQFDVYFRFADADPFASSIQCPIGSTSACFLTSDTSIPALLTSEHALLPGVLHAYTANMAAYVTPVPEPRSWALLLTGLLGLAAAGRQQR
jgi:hypothetical protein